MPHTASASGAFVPALVPASGAPMAFSESSELEALNFSLAKLNCNVVPNPDFALEFSNACFEPDENKGCYPPMYLLGVQKAATTSIAQALKSCGLAAFGIPDEQTGPLIRCSDLNNMCKESLHNDVDIKTRAGRHLFKYLHNSDRCRLVEPEPVQDLKLHKRLLRSCRQGQWLTATPLFAGAPTVTELLTNLPKSHVTRARFAVIFRDPTPRMLSWYNHQLSSGFYGQWNGRNASSFQDFWQQCEQWKGCGIEFSNYTDWLEQYETSVPEISRTQLLVLSYDDVISQPAMVMRTLTTHYGLPKVLAGMDALPESNVKDVPEKVISMKCETRKAMRQFFEPMNRMLYRRLRHDREYFRSPWIEPSFPRFNATSVPCSHSEERTLGTLSVVELMDHYEGYGRRASLMRLKEQMQIQ